MTHYLKNGNIFNVTRDAAIDIRDHLPVGTYAVKFNPFESQYFLEAVTPFKSGGKLYGDVRDTADRILNTFSERPNQTGVLLSGVAGTGKTMLARVLSTTAADQGIPTLMVNDNLFGETFNQFMQTIDQPAVVIFDEFEKVYSKDEQAALLTLFDGVYPSKKLFVVTANDRYRINDHMINRPGRIFYNIEYEGLDTAFILEYCEDNLKNQKYAKQVAAYGSLFEHFSFDMLKSLVEEMNRYDESPEDASRILNAKPTGRTSVSWDVVATMNGEPLEQSQWPQIRSVESPITSELLVFSVFPSGVSSEEEDDFLLELTRSDLITMDATEGVATFRKIHGKDTFDVKMTRREKITKTATYWDWM